MLVYKNYTQRYKNIFQMLIMGIHYLNYLNLNQYTCLNIHIILKIIQLIFY